MPLKGNIMKKIIICIFVLYTSFVTQANEIVIPDLALGHWVTTTDTSAFIEQALASIPEESRTMVRQMMTEKMKSSSTSDQCITKDTLKNIDKQMKDAFGDNQCELNITKSNKKKLAVSMTCLGSVININTSFINAKLSESAITTNVEGMASTTMKMTSKWKSSICPKGI